MRKNRDILNSLAPENGTNWKVKLDERRKNKAWIRKSMDIVLDILDAIHEQGMTQKDLANQLGVSPQTVSKTLSGKENLSLETITRYEEVLGITLIHTGVQKVENRTVEKEYVFIPVSFNASPDIQDDGVNFYKDSDINSMSPWS